jgi:hypothetical protein
MDPEFDFGAIFSSPAIRFTKPASFAWSMKFAG